MQENVSAIACMEGSVASGSASGVLRMHNTSTGAQQQQLKLPCPSLVSNLHVPCASSLASSCVLGACFNKVHAFAPEFGVLAGEFEPHADLITCMSSAPIPGGSGLLYTASEDTTVKAWPVDAERNPWMTVAPPLFEIDSPDASIPMAVKVCLHLCVLFTLCIQELSWHLVRFSDSCSAVHISAVVLTGADAGTQAHCSSSSRVRCRPLCCV